jgi:hypothetical protein
MDWGTIAKFIDDSPTLAGIIGTVIGGLLLAFIFYVVSRIRQISLTNSLIHFSEKIVYAAEWLWDHRLRSNIRITEAEQKASAQMRLVKEDAQEEKIALNQLLAEEQARTAMHRDQAISYSLRGDKLEEELAKRTTELEMFSKYNTYNKEKYEESEALANTLADQLKVANARVAALSETLKEAKRMQKSPKLPAVPGLQARWVISEVEEGENVFRLENVVPGSVAFNVRLKESNGDFKFRDGALWPQLHGGSYVDFRGKVTGNALKYGIFFEVLWYDHKGEPQSAQNNLIVT